MFNPIYKIILLLICLSLLACSKDDIHTANQDLAFMKYYGGTSDQVGTNVIPATDGGYVLFGTTESFGNGGKDFYLVKVDEKGNEEWSHTYGTAQDEEAVRIIATTSGYLMLGNTVDTLSYSKIILVATDDSGNWLWEDILKESWSSNETAADVKEYSSTVSGYVVVGTTDDVSSKPDSDPTTDLMDVYTSLRSTSGEELWEEVYGFPFNDQGAAVEILGDNIIVVGTSNTGSSNELLRIGYNESGGLTDKGEYAATFAVKAKSTCITDNALIILGESINNTLVLAELAVDASSAVFANEMTFITDLAIGSTNGDKPAYIQATTDGGYILTSTLEVDAMTNIRLSKIDATGTIDWENDFGSFNDDSAGSVHQLSDGGYLFAGSMNISTNTMMCLVRTNSLGQLTPD